MKYLLLLFFLQLNAFAQQSALDTIAIQIQTHINNNRIKVQPQYFTLGTINDSLWVNQNDIDFIRGLNFDQSKLKDSFVYALLLVHNPLKDTVIVDIYPAGGKLGESVFITPAISGEFSGGFRRHTEILYDYIKKSGVAMYDSLEFTVYFKDNKPYDALYVQSSDSCVQEMILIFYNATEKKRYTPPVRNGRLQFSSHLFKYKRKDSRVYGEGYKEYENLMLTDKYMYSLNTFRDYDTTDSLLVYDRKNNIKSHLTDGFLNQFSLAHHSVIRELITGLKRKGGIGSAILKVNIVEK